MVSVNYLIRLGGKLRDMAIEMGLVISSQLSLCWCCYHEKYLQAACIDAIWQAT
jgi:hypothetical protein